MEFGGGRKRGRPHGPMNGNGGFKKSKQELESIPTGIGSKSKPCTKFFRHQICEKNLLVPCFGPIEEYMLDMNQQLGTAVSMTWAFAVIDLLADNTSGCPFGEGCHFLHYVPGGLKAVTQMLGSNPALPAASRNSIAPPSFPDGSAPPAVKTRLCTKYNTAEGCKFGDKCRFAHGEWELGRPAAPLHEESHGMFQMHGRYGNRPETNPAGIGAAASFGSSATAKISVDASLAGRIIGKGGVNSKQICRVTGVKFSIRDHESDPNLRNIELEGTIDQIEQASRMVRELIQSVTTSATSLMKNTSSSATSNYKTKICENFAKSSCTFGEKCHFAHGAEELRRSGFHQGSRNDFQIFAQHHFGVACTASYGIFGMLTRIESVEIRCLYIACKEGLKESTSIQKSCILYWNYRSPEHKSLDKTECI
ncbi:hypothetical protein HAX54_036874 [Datura stramonium]|uniref:C3H1-type domain-containing protein n=1 Tax=Datura stramonium TaxID=4076 RepID=A0ABS8VKN6_DATST|nr:hypothetical protein [Datura stramonium]